MRVLLILSILFATGKLFSQQTLQSLCEKDKYAVMFFYKGDIVTIPCDTLVVVNTATYRLYDLVFRSNSKTLSKNEKLINSLYDNSKVLYEHRIIEQQKDIERLQNQNDSLIRKSLALVKNTSPQLDRVDASLTEATRSIEKANSNIEEAITMVRSEMRTSNRRKVKWGLGGFGLGVITTALILSLGEEN
jgi:hypothetical protein